MPAELLPSTQQTAYELTTDIRQLIQPAWQEFESTAAGEAVQTLGHLARLHEYPYSLHKLPPFVPAQGVMGAEEIASRVFDAQIRTETFLEGVIQEHARRKRRAVPDIDDPAASTAILAHVVSGGIERVMDYLSAMPVVSTRNLERNSVRLHTLQEEKRVELLAREGRAKDMDTVKQPPDSDNAHQTDPYQVIKDVTWEDQMAHLSLTLFMVVGQLAAQHMYERRPDGTLEATASQAEINTAIDVRLQAACQSIQDNKKLATPKGADNIDRLFNGSMNCLRTFYYRGRNPQFKRQAYITCCLSYDYKEADQLRRRGEYELMRRSMYAGFADVFNTALGSDYDYPGAQAAAKLNQEVLDHRRTGKGDKRNFRTLVDIANIHATRQLVDQIANGQLKYSAVVAASMQLYAQPLASRVRETIDVPDEELDWEILPIGMLEGELSDRRPAPDLEVQTPEYERKLDWRRIENLKKYVVDWGNGYFARAKIPGLSADKMYYVAVLPQYLPDGSVIEHAIADHPEEGNGLYIWRAERADMRTPGDKNVGLTWRKVFSHKRIVARMLGAKRYYHTANLAYNVLDYLTCPPEELIAQRYAVGGGVMRIARLVQADNV